MNNLNIPVAPPSLANADIIATAEHNSVLLIKNDSLWVYEHFNKPRSLQRSTPSVIADVGPQDSLIANLSTQWKNLVIKRTKSKVYLDLYGNTIMRCGRCDSIYMPINACPCEVKLTRCGMCHMPKTRSVICNTHCAECCDCWLGTCGCIFTYIHNTENHPLHYAWNFGDTMHDLSTCGKCTTHCDCVFCECGNVHVGLGRTTMCDFCNSVKHISNCCPQQHLNPYTVGRDYTIAFRSFGTEPIFCESRTFKENECKRFLSPEIEIAHVQPTDWRFLAAAETTLEKLKVATVPELSIPNGVELNPQPANGDLFIANIRKICNVVGKLNAQITNRCGLHVHVDARDYTTDDLARFLYLFCIVEPLVYNLVEYWRRDTKYCVKSQAYKPFGIPTLDIHKLKKFLYGGNLEYYVIKQKKRKNTSSQDIRYRGLNLHSYFYRGTLEFRHHHGSVNATEIIHWAMFCGFLLDVAKVAHWEWLLGITKSIANPKAFYVNILTKIPKNTPNYNNITHIITTLYNQQHNVEEEAAEIPAVAAPTIDIRYH